MSIPGFVLLQGVITGLSYGLLALGLVLIYRTNRVLNFAQGQLGVLAAVFLVKLHVDFHFNYVFALVLAVALAAAVGAISELVLRRLFHRPRVLVMVATIGLSQVFFVLASLPFIRPKNLSKPFPVPINLSFSIDHFVFTPGEVLTLIVAPIIALALAAFIKFSPWGLAMRAMSENNDSARLSGVWVRRASTLAWTLAGILSAFTAILNAPGQTTSLTQVLSPDLLVLALTAALVGAMVNLTVAFVAGIGVGIVDEILAWNYPNTATQQLILFALLMVVLLVRVSALKRETRGGERSTWLQGATTIRHSVDKLRDRVGMTGVGVVVVLAALLPVVLSTGNDLLMSQVCIYAVIALSLTLLTGWAGQVSLGQFGLVAVGAIMAARLGTSVPLILLLPFAGAVTAVVAVLVGLPALRMPGLYLAVSTLGFAIFMQETVLATPCFTVPVINRQVCTGLPNPLSTLIPAPSIFGISLASEQSFAWFSLIVLVVCILIVRFWRDRGLARRLVSVRDNEITAAAMGIPILRTKVLAFALSGFLAGVAGVCYAFSLQRFDVTSFDPSLSFQVISMVVIGGLGSIPGAVLGALYLQGLPAIFGTSSTIEFLTSGLGLVAFILYLPGGLAEIMHRFGDLATDVVRRVLPRLQRGAPAGTSGAPVPAAEGGATVAAAEGAAASAAPTPDAAAPAPTPSPEPAPAGATPAAEPVGAVASHDGRGPARLDVQGLRVAFGGVTAVRSVSFTAEPGAIVGLIGANGSGKTTTLDAISALVTPESGVVRMDGEDLTEYLPEERMGIGLIRSFQDCRLFPELSVEDTLLLSEDARRPVGVLSSTLQLPWARRAEREKRQAVDRVIAAFGIERFRHHRASELSTGTRRVVDLASVVLANPRLLLLDEPTAGIAQREAEAFIPLLRRLHEVADTTIVLVEHDVPLVFQLCSTVVVMETGEVVSIGPPDEVRQDPRALAAYLGASEEALAASGPGEWVASGKAAEVS